MNTMQLLIIDSSDQRNDIREWLNLMDLDNYTIELMTHSEAMTADIRNVNIFFLDGDYNGEWGLEVLHHIRKINPLSKVVFVSGHPTDANLRQALDAGANHALGKPYELGVVRDLLTEYQRSTE